jgi:hypothetical protein
MPYKTQEELRAAIEQAMLTYPKKAAEEEGDLDHQVNEEIQSQPGENFTNFLLSQDAHHQKTLSFMKLYEKTAANQNLYQHLSLPHRNSQTTQKAHKLMQENALQQRSQYKLVLNTIKFNLKADSLKNGGKELLDLNLDPVYFSSSQDASVPVAQ